MRAFSIRKSTRADIPQLIDFINESWVRTYAPLIGESVAEELATAKHTQSLFESEIDAADALSLTAKDTQNRVIGHVGGFKKAQRCIYIDRLHVAPAWMGKGVAKDLVAAAVRDASSKAFETLELTVLEGNDRAMAFYAKSGFVVDKARSPTEGLGDRKATTMVRKIGKGGN